MPEVPVETFANPFAPPDQDQGNNFRRANLSNDDFRRLLMTPKVTAANPEAPVATKLMKPSVERREEDSKRLKKKSLYSKLKKEEDERQAEWDKKYRDRARERRDDKNPDYTNAEEALPSTSSYRAVAPAGLVDPSVVAERRKQAIVESKFLGGDIQHTHLVKGLDFVLLDKVRSEMLSKEKDAREQSLMERKREKERVKAEANSDDLKFCTTLGRNIYRHCFLVRPPMKNELFSAGRMAYVFNLDDDEEYADSDIPTTLIRSKADCPVPEVTTLTTNDIVINKLTQILSYLRQGVRAGRKGKKKDKVGALPGKPAPPMPRLLPATVQQNIFDGVGEYDSKVSSKVKTPASLTQQFKYFDSSLSESNRNESAVVATDVSELVREGTSALMKDEQPPPPDSSQHSGPEPGGGGGDEKGLEPKRDSFGFGLSHHYAECYPGGMEEVGGSYDSDDDADFTKMDMGNKKGPVKRWDFENEDDYSQYQSKREALPKAAFQYGVKMSDGRKTRRYGGGSLQGRVKEKAKLDREWQQISAILDKRKSIDAAGGPSTKRTKVD